MDSIRTARRVRGRATNSNWFGRPAEIGDQRFDEPAAFVTCPPAVATAPVARQRKPDAGCGLRPGRQSPSRIGIALAPCPQAHDRVRAGK